MSLNVVDATVRELVKYINNKIKEEWLVKERMKLTNVFSDHPNPKFKPPCKNGDKCHVAAPRVSRTPGSTQGIKGAKLRAVIPEQLCRHIVDICEEDFNTYINK